jgi:hypothetical protein
MGREIVIFVQWEIFFKSFSIVSRIQTWNLILFFKTYQNEIIIHRSYFLWAL